jgi:RNA polymerase sigma-70 factor (ECF subfamily)
MRKPLRPLQVVLIQRARSGDTGALNHLLESYRGSLWQLARAHVEASHLWKVDPADVAQEALIRAARRFSQFRGSTEAELAGWLRRILTRCRADLARRLHQGFGVRQEISLDALGSRCPQDLEELLASSAWSPAETAERRDREAALGRALGQLRPDYREVVVLRNLEGLSWAEVARRMGRTPGAARMLWTRALAEIRPLLEGRV